MKKLALLLAVLVLGGGIYIATLDAPLKTAESLVMRYADVLPLGYFGGKLFDRHCAGCHDNPNMHAPSREALANFSLESVWRAMEFGKMQPMAVHLSRAERYLIARYLTGDDGEQYAWLDQNTCGDAEPQRGRIRVANWGLGEGNRRFVSASETVIRPGNVHTLELAWAVAFPRVADMRSQPAVIGNTLYLGDKTGRLYAFDRERGCLRRHSKVVSGIRSAITVATDREGDPLLVFADSTATIYAVEPQTLKKRWQTSALLFDTSVITGSISYHQGRLYVPVSSYEVAAAGSPLHSCCSSHGGVVALDAADGRQLWTWHATPDATGQGSTSEGAPLFGPSGASVWSTPTIDAARNRLYIGTGENLSHPATDTSDAVIALDLDTGEMVWHYQAIENDVWNSACLNGGANCPDNAGGDFDIGASIIHARLDDGLELLLAGQKSGDALALDMNGKLLWKTRVSNAAIGPNLHQTTTNGGVHWGMALSGERLLVPAADPERRRPGYIPRPGINALDVRSGEVLWRRGVERGCFIAEKDKPLAGLQDMLTGKPRPLQEQYRCSFYYGLSAAATATRELVFSGGLDGRLRAYNIQSGEILWETATAVPFDTVNGVIGHGGSIDVDGAVLVDDWLYLQSGYSMFNQLPGNVLLAFKLADRD